MVFFYALVVSLFFVYPTPGRRRFPGSSSMVDSGQVAMHPAAMLSPCDRVRACRIEMGTGKKRAID
jgi:hypothetical protein